jgi:hypothetical protein
MLSVLGLCLQTQAKLEEAKAEVASITAPDPMVAELQEKLQAAKQAHAAEILALQGAVEGATQGQGGATAQLELRARVEELEGQVRGLEGSFLCPQALRLGGS